MATSPSSEQYFELEVKQEEEVEKENCYAKTYEMYEDIITTLPKEKGWMTEHLVQYQGVWLSPMSGVEAVMLVQQHFEPLPTDILLATFPKAGTTWFKALIFAIVNRARYQISSHPLLTTGPHGCVPFLETIIDQKHHIYSPHLSSPRLLSTHIPYAILPDSIKTSGSRIVYVCRDPKDVLVSQWQYLKKMRHKELPPLSLEDAFELFCNGVAHFGPYWNHVLGYWNVALQSPEKVFFINYEEIRTEPIVHVKRLAEFLGHPFSLTEEREGEVQEIIRLCSFEHLSNLEVNKTGVQQFTDQFAVKNCDFFRKAQIGDWKNHLTATMAEHLDQITMQRFNGSGLTLHVSPQS